jgi:hypothetical protein
LWPTPCRRRRAICSFSWHLVQQRLFVVLRMLMLSLAHGALFSASQKRGSELDVLVVVCVPRAVCEYTWSYAAIEMGRSSLAQQGKPRRRRARRNLRRMAGAQRAVSRRASLQIPRSYGELLHARSEHRKASAVTARLGTTCGARAYPQRSRRQRQSVRRPSAGSCDRRRLKRNASET